MKGSVPLQWRSSKLILFDSKSISLCVASDGVAYHWVEAEINKL